MEHFIETMRKYPCLWNTTSAEYRDQELKDAAWAEVMKDTDTASVKEVKLKWKKLRDSYRDALKRHSDMLAREPPAQGKRNYHWKYMGLMQFLQPHMNVRKKPPESPGHPAPTGAAPHEAHNGDARSSSSSSSGGSSPAPARSPRRRDRRPARLSGMPGLVELAAIDRKLEYLCRASSASAGKRPHTPPPAPLDPLDIFFNGMCQTTKRFPYHTQVKIKRLVFNAVVEAEEALVAEQQSYASLWARGGGSSSGSDRGGPS